MPVHLLGNATLDRTQEVAGSSPASSTSEKSCTWTDPALAAMFKQLIANNRAGGWRKLKREA